MSLADKYVAARQELLVRMVEERQARYELITSDREGDEVTDCNKAINRTKESLERFEEVQRKFDKYYSLGER